MSAPIIEVENLSKLYRIGEIGAGSIREEFSRFWERLRGRAAPHDDREFWALSDVSFSVEPGEVVGIIGRNGAGKSTLLKILSRITEPTSGRAVLRGRVASLLEVGTGFHPDLTGRDNIYLNGAILGMKRAEIRAKFDEIVAFAEVEKFIDTPVKRYSSGMYVRLAFAVAAHLEPEILIVDEVLAVGDIAFQKKCLGKMREVSHQQGRTVLFVSHNLPAVRQLCSSALLLAEGRLVTRGAVSGVLQRYHDGIEATGEVSLQPSPELLDRAYVSSVRLETLDRRATTTVRVGVAWRISVGFTVARPMQSFVAALGIVASDGTPVQTAWSRPQTLPPGAYEATFTQQAVKLAAGSYSLVAGLNEADQTIQQIKVAQLDIDGAGGHADFPMTAGAGLVLNSMDIALSPR